MKKFLVSCAYIYPLCPLSINHAKMFVIADIIARNERRKGKNVFFPIAAHYSGNSAQNISKSFTNFFSKDNAIENDEEKKIFNLYKNTYNTPTPILRTFIHPLNILRFYNREILWELKSLNISCDYEHFYATDHKDFSDFINEIISIYEESNLLVSNKKKELALDYNNNNWKKRTIDLINQVEFLQPFHRNNVISATKDVRNDWSLLRKNGFGVNYKKWIVDPMFDSEIFTIFDLYVKYKDKRLSSNNTRSFFKDLFKSLKSRKRPKDTLIKKIIDFLPCSVLICEEHLKNWIVKKFYAESLLLNEKYQTKKYFILGMGFLDGKQMSASKGHAILAKDLIDCHGSIKTRLIIILSGGHPSKMYNYDKSIPIQAGKLLNGFINHYAHLLSVIDDNGSDNAFSQEEELDLICSEIEKEIEQGYYRQATIELLSILPKKYYQFPTVNMARNLILVYHKYIDILLPGLLDGFGYYGNF